MRRFYCYGNRTFSETTPVSVVFFVSKLIYTCKLNVSGWFWLPLSQCNNKLIVANISRFLYDHIIASLKFKTDS